MKKPVDCRLPIADCRLKPQMNADERRPKRMPIRLHLCSSFDSAQDGKPVRRKASLTGEPFVVPVQNRKSEIGNRKFQGGFVLILVIIAMAVIGIEMSVLASVGNTMQFQSHRAYLQACRRNLTASGLAWARQNIPNKTGEGVPEAIKLDTGEMNIRGSDLHLAISRPSGKEAEVLIKTSCSRGRQTLKGETRYRLSL